MKTPRLSSLLLCGTALAAALATGSVQEARAALSYSTPDAVYSQDFNTLPNTPENATLQSTIPWTDDSTSTATQTSLPGWYLYHPTSQAEGGANGHQRFRIGPGSSTTGSFYSFGSTGSSDRALGDLGASTLASDTPTSPEQANLYIALRLHNDTGQTLDSFTLGYTGEQWHCSTITETMSFGWSTTATSVSDLPSAFNAVTELGWTAPFLGTAEAAVDGNNYRVVVSPITVSGINWAPGTDLWLRWTDPQYPSLRDNGMAIDDLAFYATVPEPAAGSLVLLGLAGMAAVRRLRSN